VAIRVVMAFQAEVPQVLVDVQQFLSAFCVSADSLLYHFGMEGSQLYDFCKLLPVVLLSQPLTSEAQDTQLPSSSLLGLRREVSKLVVVFPL
jgi:hypothetical protein